MPFTLAHPAAALPLARLMGRYAVLSALAIGSMMPDLPFFLGISLPREQTHGVSTLVTWSLPAGLLMYALFHTLLRQALTELAPPSVQRRLGAPGGPMALTAVAASLMCGAATHLFWDAFTHPGTLFVTSLPFLQSKLASFGGYDLYLFKVVQHASSVVGLSLLTWWSWGWYARTPEAAAAAPAFTGARRWQICFMLAAIPLATGAAAAWHGGWSPARMATFVFTTLPVFFWLLTGFALVRQYGRLRT